MKKLQETFVMNADKCGNHNFTQIRRENGIALYRRNRVNDNRFHSFEVFIVRIVKAGASLPGGGSVVEDYEQYPGSSTFGRTAWSISGREENALACANKKFNELLKGAAPVVEIEGAEPETEIVHVARVSKGEIKFQPPNEGWTGTQKELAAFLGLTNYKEAYTPLQKWLGTGILKVVGERDSARGKKAKIFGRC